MVEQIKKKRLDQDLPDGFKLEDGIAYGSRVAGLFEIKFHSENKNALTVEGSAVLARLLSAASSDVTVKCVLLHGGRYFGSGNNLKVLMQ